MQTAEQVQTIFNMSQSGLDYPGLITLLKEAGIRGYSYHIASGDTVCYDGEGDALSLRGHKTGHHVIAREKNMARLTHALLTHQAGLMGFDEFCQQAAGAGVNLWVADLTRMTVSYFSSGGELIHEENIPAASPISTQH
jgi:uncharacterized protein YbcV (DUF1398 family)